MSVPEGLGERGSALWGSLAGELDLTAAASALAVEACRLADRLERMDLLLRGDETEWARFRIPRGLELENGVLEVRVSGVLQEARQQQAVFQQLVATVVKLSARESDDLSDALSGFMAGLSAPLRNET